jgi:cation transport ATPase
MICCKFGRVSHRYTKVAHTKPFPFEIKENMVLLVAAGEKIGADGTYFGASEIDTSLITGEPAPICKDRRYYIRRNDHISFRHMRVTKASAKLLLSEITADAIC